MEGTVKVACIAALNKLNNKQKRLEKHTSLIS
jgi:hypothetical protein